MELGEYEFYMIESHQDKLDILEFIYEHKPELLFNTDLYDYRYLKYRSNLYPFIGTSFSGDKLDCYTSSNISQFNLLSKQEFLKKVIGRDFYDFTPLTQKRMKHNFLD